MRMNRRRAGRPALWLLPLAFLLIFYFYPLGRVLAAGLRNVRSPREVMKESIEETGRAVVHDLERFLTTLGTIASISRRSRWTPQGGP